MCQNNDINICTFSHFDPLVTFRKTIMILSNIALGVWALIRRPQTIPSDGISTLYHIAFSLPFNRPLGIVYSIWTYNIVFRITKTKLYYPMTLHRSPFYSDITNPATARELSLAQQITITQIRIKLLWLAISAKYPGTESARIYFILPRHSLFIRLQRIRLSVHKRQELL